MGGRSIADCSRTLTPTAPTAARTYAGRLGVDLADVPAARMCARGPSSRRCRLRPDRPGQGRAGATMARPKHGAGAAHNSADRAPERPPCVSDPQAWLRRRKSGAASHAVGAESGNRPARGRVAKRRRIKCIYRIFTRVRSRSDHTMLCAEWCMWYKRMPGRLEAEPGKSKAVYWHRQ